MNYNLNGSSVPLWQATNTIPIFPPLTNNTKADVCIIGGGIGGISTAYLLSKNGKKVILIDANLIGGGETGRTTAHFFPPDEWYSKIEKSFSTDVARLIARGFSQATNLVEYIIEEEQIECSFERVTGYLYSLSDKGFIDLHKELEAANRSGVTAQIVEQVPEISFSTGPAIQFPNQAQFHPLKYLQGLTKAFLDNGGVIHCDTRALSIEGNNTLQKVSTNGGEINCQAVVVATNTPFNDTIVLHTKQAAYRTYVIGLRIPNGSVPHILMWDHGHPYYYLRIAKPDPNSDHEILVVGGA
ncbi:NAD(P)/FAD-dependent oxidoreductase, partial [Nitrosomonas supralitoralis]